ncbi:NAD-dependent epimerase/dehydratase family protein [Mycetocola zhujimingii]|uniref:polysaccharide biosynthesis C-terminal domain-containing protein n=1 Tax=Mycetocola zhujimingii TaxID=2079792 RepID=UPI001F3D75AE|nr:NAD-dependent epimerase/dehydratase family protein [Mycetocola zhujimingii]
MAVQTIPLGDRYSGGSAAQSMSGASRVVHLAGVNRGTDDEVRDGNKRLAEQVADSITRAEDPPRSVVFANSTQSGNGSLYGAAKADASDTLRNAAEQVGASFHDVILPNLFGEHGVPFYNAVTATFSHLIANGERPSVDNDKELTLLHAQDAADVLLGTVDAAQQSGLEVQETVSGLLARLTAIDEVYRRGEIPDVASTFDRNLFNTFRSYTFPAQTPIGLTRHADARGSFFEIIRSHGGNGQSSFSTTVPGISRGDHFHRRKVERFTVLSGSATISLRKLFTDDVFEFRVTGDEPAAVDMPTMWTHKITNTGTDDLYTSFWSNDIFDPDAPDTIAEAV